MKKTKDDARTNELKLRAIQRIYDEWRIGIHGYFSHSHNAMIEIGITLKTPPRDPEQDHMTAVLEDDTKKAFYEWPEPQYGGG